MNKLNKLGKFHISQEIIEANPEAVMKLFAEMVVLKCECLYQYISHRFEYIAYSPRFEELEPGQKIPFYNVKVEELRGDDEVIDYDFSFERVSE